MHFELETTRKQACVSRQIWKSNGEFCAAGSFSFSCNCWRGSCILGILLSGGMTIRASTRIAFHLNASLQLMYLCMLTLVIGTRGSRGLPPLFFDYLHPRQKNYWGNGIVIQLERRWYQVGRRLASTGGSWRPFSRSALLPWAQRRTTSPDQRAWGARVAPASWDRKMSQRTVSHPCLPWMRAQGIMRRRWSCRKSTRASERDGSLQTVLF